MLKRLSVLLVLVSIVGVAAGFASPSSASVATSQQKFCNALTGEGGATVFSQAAATGNGATGLAKSLQKLAKTTSSKSLKSALTTMASFYKRLGKGQKVSDFSPADATKFSKAVAKFTSAAASCTPVTSPSSGASHAGLSGTWSGQYTGASSGTFTLTWQQSGSNLTGTILISGLGGIPININGTVSGSSINFGTVGAAAVTYTGTVSGNSMSGTYQSPIGNGNWTATKTS